MTSPETILNNARKLINKQAEDEGLWFIAETASEAYLQRALRNLHAVIENNDRDLAILEGRVK